MPHFLVHSIMSNPSDLSYYFYLKKIHPNESFVEQLMELEKKLKMKDMLKGQECEKQCSKTADNGFGRVIRND